MVRPFSNTLAAPVRVHRLLRWCLEKDRKQRLASIGDARRVLAENEAATSAATIPSGSRFVWVAWSLAAIGCAAALSLTAWMFLRPADDPAAVVSANKAVQTNDPKVGVNARFNPGSEFSQNCFASPITFGHLLLETPKSTMMGCDPGLLFLDEWSTFVRS